jgi:large subunit ribosomal protein L23
VGRKNSKEEIKKEIEKSFNVKVDKVRTHIKDNKKFAYVKLNSKNPAIDIATKFGLI